ncbi:2Fe-2S iron-sulfur cluster-binding protein [Celeribacter neptunius]|uniref:Ferredoxin, 2Fe-2S n=1 Tax=Celeribacter neptunius TaxID=588602 RepID=A0A1I3XYS2_9RHOB|nr:2Fe-2S iron-sulfur cluster-binding protein [Celeribacter neptunius]SFK24136.1 ferredoxin, 2Fe-2S [Celeribacter neptunius]
MAKVTFVDHDGTKHEVEAPIGNNLMEIAVNNNIAGIDGDCGGMAACATCHVTVDPAWYAKTGARSEAEESMLTFLPEIAETARLGCQIEMTEELDGLVLHLPVEQF